MGEGRQLQRNFSMQGHPQKKKLLEKELVLFNLLVLDCTEQRCFDVGTATVWNLNLQVTKLSIVKVSNK